MRYSWETFKKLEDNFGDSFYILDIDKFTNNYNEFLSEFRTIYKNTHIAYSYKTNYIPQVCRAVNSNGGYAEVVSIMEYDLAIMLGVKPHKIIFNGPYKTENHIQKALCNGSRVNLDSKYEVQFVEKTAKKFPELKLHVGIRCNFQLNSNHTSRFGFDVDNPDFRDAIKRLNNIPNCKLSGLHCHFSTSNRSLDSFEIRIKKMLELTAKNFPLNYPEYIDIGGGFFSKMSLDLQKQFGVKIPSYKDYAHAIATHFIDFFNNTFEPKLILEPGTAITADIMKFVTKVIGIKTIQSKNIATLSGSVYNIKPTLNDKNLPINVYQKGKKVDKIKEKRSYDFGGYTCKENDYLYRGYSGRLEIDDYVVFDNVGAYTIVLKPPFILPNAPILIYDRNNQKFELIKNKESLSDVFSTFIF